VEQREGRFRDRTACEALCASVNGHREMCWLSSVDAPHRRPEWVLTGYSATLKRVERIEVGAGLADALQVGQ
jgi:hypothetical protein